MRKSMRKSMRKYMHKTKIRLSNTSTKKTVKNKLISSQKHVKIFNYWFNDYWPKLLNTKPNGKEYIHQIITIGMNYLLILLGLRKIAQIEIYKESFPYIPDFINFMNKFKIPYILEDGANSRWKRIIIYDKKTFNLDTLNTTYGINFGHQLGEFYVCASDNWNANNNDYNHRIAILIKMPKLIYNQGNKIIPVFAQMCNESILKKNKITFNKIAKKLKKLLLLLHPDFTVIIEYIKDGKLLSSSSI
jgi:hypothetical protein